MKNLAGNRDCDKFIKEELYLAGITAINIGGSANTEVPYSIIGRLGNWTLKRAWYYWIASVENREDGLPLDVAMELYNTPNPINKNCNLGESIRAGGDAGCSSPDEYIAKPVFDEGLDEQLLKLGYVKEYSETLKKDYIRINYGQVNKLCREGKLNVQRYVESYHIDDQIGLNEFAKLIKFINQ